MDNKSRVGSATINARGSLRPPSWRGQRDYVLLARACVFLASIASRLGSGSCGRLESLPVYLLWTLDSILSLGTTEQEVSFTRERSFIFVSREFPRNFQFSFSVRNVLLLIGTTSVGARVSNIFINALIHSVEFII